MPDDSGAGNDGCRVLIRRRSDESAEKFNRKFLYIDL